MHTGLCGAVCVCVCVCWATQLVKCIFIWRRACGLCLWHRKTTYYDEFIVRKEPIRNQFRISFVNYLKCEQENQRRNKRRQEKCTRKSRRRIWLKKNWAFAIAWFDGKSPWPALKQWRKIQQSTNGNAVGEKITKAQGTLDGKWMPVSSDNDASIYSWARYRKLISNECLSSHGASVHLSIQQGKESRRPDEMANKMGSERTNVLNGWMDGEQNEKMRTHSRNQLIHIFQCTHHRHMCGLLCRVNAHNWI